MSAKAVIRMPGEGKEVTLAGKPMTFLVTGEDTKHTSMFDWTLPPGLSTGLHVHHVQEETFYVLEGEFSIAGADHNNQVVQAGDTVHIPADEPHGYRNVGASTGRFLAILAPADLDDFFRELGTPAPGATAPTPLAGPPDIDRLRAVTARHKVEMLP